MKRKKRRKKNWRLVVQGQIVCYYLISPLDFLFPYPSIFHHQLQGMECLDYLIVRSSLTRKYLVPIFHETPAMPQMYSI